MMRSLYSQIAAVLLGIFLVTVLIFLSIAGFSLDMYRQEVTQKLNRELAAHILREQGNLLRDRRVNDAALQELFGKMMTVNPNIEIYLTDSDGRLLAYSAKPALIQRSQIDLEPVRRFLAADGKLPVVGDDPRDATGRKIFSAAAIPARGEPEGYLYVILGGQEYDSVAQRLLGSYVMQLGLAGVGAGLLFVLLVGLILFALITRRVTRLAGSVERFRHSDFSAPMRLDRRARGHDEIDQLGTAFHELSKRLVDQMRDLKDIDKLRRELVANISHDLRTPLATLQGYLETLLRKHGQLDDAEQQQYLEIAHQHGERLGKLVTELFELAKLDSASVQLHRELFPITELVQDVAQEFRRIAERAGIRLDVEVDSQAPLVNADIGLIQRLLANLLENALRYTPHGGEVRLRLYTEARQVGIRIDDSGCGIAADELPHVFERFYRSRDSHARHPGGAGLGLAIARRIVELHGGEIHLTSTAGSGTQLHVQLPIHGCPDAA